MITGFKKHLHRLFAWQTALVLVLSSFAPLMPFVTRTAYAAVTVSTDMVNLPNGNVSGAPISPQAQFPSGIIRFSVTPTASATLSSVRVELSGTGFASTDLRSIPVAGSPFDGGVVLLRDGGTIGSLGGGDSPVELSTSTDWLPASNNVILTPSSTVALTSGATQYFFIAVFASTTISNGDQIIATIPVNGIVTSQGSGPASPFTSSAYVADTIPPTITSFEGSAGSPTTVVRFSEPVQSSSNDALSAADSSLSYVHGGGAQTISSISHTKGQNFATVLLSGNITADDLDAASSTIAAGSDKVMDLAGNLMSTATVGLASPLRITTPVIPTITAGAVSNIGSPILTFTGSGGVTPYSFAPADSLATTTMVSLGLSLSPDGKLYGTATSTPTSVSLPIRITDASSTSAVRSFTINISGAGGSIPGVSSVTPAGGPQSGSVTVSVVGTNTAFSGLSTVEFLMPLGVGGTNAVTASGVSVTDATHLSFTATIGADATAAARDLRIVTGGQNITVPNAFTVFAGGGGGLNQLLPVANATGIPIPPGLSFSQSSEVSALSYRVKVKPAFDVSESVTPIWDYAFTKTASEGTSHCNASQCNVNYGVGTYRVITPPTPLAPNTDYYWQVYTYATTTSAVNAAGVTPLEVTAPRRFTTTESVTDTVPPNILHRPVFRARESSPLYLYAKVFDNIATQDTTPALSVSVYYCQGSGCTPASTAVCSTAPGGVHVCTIPSGVEGVGADGTITRYYLRATDGTNTNNFRQPDGSPFQLTAAAVGALTVSGSIKDAAGACPAGIQGALVVAEGTSYATTTSATCDFALENLPAGTYDIGAFHDGYMERHVDGIAAGTTGLDLRLNTGSGGGFGGDTTRPTVRMTCPVDASRNMPGGDSNFKICVGFSEPMNQTTVNTSGGLMVRELNPATGGSTDITTSKGSWTYYPTAPAIAGIPAQPNMAVWSFSGSNNFGDDKTIAVSVGSSVADTAGNAIQGNQPDGSYAFSFTTGRAFVALEGFGGGAFGSGAFIPPRVVGSTPTPGAFNIPRNSRIVVNFSEAMADDAGGYVMRTCLKLFPVSDVSETSILSSATLDSSKRIATLVPTGVLTASTQYRLKVLSTCRAGSGLTLGPPGGATQTMYSADFRTGTGSDSTAPTITGSYPAAGATGVSVSVGAVGVSFSLDADPSTITTETVYLSVGSTHVNGSVEYRPLERRAVFTPRTALSPGTTYTLNVSTDVTALNGTALGSALARTFTTGAADTASPELRFMNADDRGISLTFSEPMNAASLLDTTNWARSVLNPEVYNVIKYGVAGFNAGSAGTVVSLAGARFSYDATENTVTIEGLDLVAARDQELYLSMDTSGSNQAKDLSGNLLASTASNVRTPVRSSVATGGALGPGAMSGSAFAAGGFVPTNISSSTFATFGQVEARPSFPTTGATSKYFLRIPLSKQIPSGGKVVVTFPSGFTLFGAKQDVMSPSRGDLNGPGSGTVKFKCSATVAGGKTCGGTANIDDALSAGGGLADDGVVVADRTVTVYLNGDTNATGYDFLTIDLDGIVNSGIPLDFNTSGYTLDIKTFNGSTLLESLTSRPFYLQSGGSNTLGGTLTMAGNDQTCSVNVYLNSPTGGSQTTQASFSGASTAAYTFSNVPSGDVFISTDRAVTCGVGGSAKNYAGKNIPERVLVSGATTYNFALGTMDSGGVAVTVTITGGVGQALDVFGGSGNSVVVRQVTPSTSPESVTLRLPDGFTGFIGVGPQIQPGASGPPPAPSYVLPRSKEVRISGSACTVDGVVGCTAAFTLTSATKTIKAIVKDASNRLMANVEVFAYAPGGFGTRGQTDSSGVATLAVNEGTYTVGANTQGLQSREASVRVSSDVSDYLFIDGATTGISPASAASTFVLKIAKPDCTITGRITDGTNVVQNAGVYARRTDGPGFSNGMTDATGNYTLYVGCTGTWEVKAFNPGYGEMTAQNVVMAGSSQSSINFSPTLVGTFYTVSGSVTVSAAAVQGAIVRVQNATSFNEAVTDSLGNYSVRVPAGTGYTVRAFIPNSGDTPPLAPFAVSSDVVGKNFTIASGRTITFIFSSAIAEGFVDLISSDGRSGHADIRGGATTTLSLPDATYEVRVGMPGVAITRSLVAGQEGTVYSTTTGLLVVDGNETLNVTLPTLNTISGTVSDGSAGIGDAWVEVVESSTNRALGVKADSSGVFSLAIPSGTYRINAMKPGYVRQASSLVVSGDMSSQTLTMSAASLAISGQVTAAGSGMASAFVRAERQGGGFTATQADTSGNYTLPVTAGTWRITAVANGYAPKEYSSQVVVDGASVTGKDIALTTATTFDLAAPGAQPLSTANGGTIQDNDAGFRLVAPPNAVSSDGSSAIFSYTETTNVPSTPGARPLPGFQLSAQGEDGNSINNFNDGVTLEMSYTPAELADQEAADGTSIDTMAEVAQLQMASFDQTTNAWDTMATTITCIDADGNPVSDPGSPAACTSIKISAITEHFSLYAPVISTDPSAPETPSGLAGTPDGYYAVNLSWTLTSGADSYDVYRSSSEGGTYVRLGSEPTVALGSTVSYTDTDLSPATRYYYKISSLNGSNESAASAAISVLTGSIASSGTGGSGGGGGAVGGGGSSSAQSITGLTQVLPTTSTAVTSTATSISTSTQALTTLVTPTSPSVTETRSETALPQTTTVSLADFLRSGTTPQTKALGSGERMAVLRDARETMGRTDIPIADLERMSQGEIPKTRNLAIERTLVPRALASFEMMFGHVPNFKNPAENLAWNTLMYRIRFPRDLKREGQGILEFRKLFKKIPSDPFQWSVVRVLGYVR